MNAAMTSGSMTTICFDLEQHLALCREVLDLVVEESEALRAPGDFDGGGFARRRASLLPRLGSSLSALHRAREAWQQLDARRRGQHPELDSLLRDNQDLIMKIIVLDRENEQGLLRRGLLAPGQLPTSQSQRPHVVAARYARNRPA